MTRRIFYTDGGSSPNPGPGGWGVVEVDGSDQVLAELSGSEADSTNNRMELSAAIAALEATAEGSEVEVVTDSTYLRKGITEWVAGWMAKGWKRRDRGRLVEVKNVDLWRKLEGLERRRNVQWHWVKGHSGNRFNERADELATAEIERLRGPIATAEPTTVETAGEADLLLALKVTCVGNRGGWAARLIRTDSTVDEDFVSGSERPTTSNRLELQASLALLQPLTDGTRIVFETGSDYLRRGASEWMINWKSQGWCTKDGSEVKNRDLWQLLERDLSRLEIDWRPLGKKTPLFKQLAAASKAALD